MSNQPQADLDPATQAGQQPASPSPKIRTWEEVKAEHPRVIDHGDTELPQWAVDAIHNGRTIELEDPEPVRTIPHPKIAMHFVNLTADEATAVLRWINKKGFERRFGETTSQELRRDVDTYELSLRWE